MEKIKKELKKLKAKKKEAQKKYDQKIKEYNLDEMTIEEEIELEEKLNDEFGLITYNMKIHDKEEILIDELLKAIDNNEQVKKELGEDVELLKEARKNLKTKKKLLNIAMKVEL